MANELFRTGAFEQVPTINPPSGTTVPNVTGSTAPPEEAYEKQLLSWIAMAKREGDAWSAAEGQLEDIDENTRIALGDISNQASERQDPKVGFKPFYRSDYQMSRIGKNVNDIASAVTDFRPIGQFKTFNTLYESQGQILDKLMEAWWYHMDVDMKLQLLVKQSLVGRTAYAHVVFNPTLHGGLGDIDIVVRDYRDVLPIRPNSKTSIQDAVGVIIQSKNTVNWGRARYPEKAHKIQPNSEGGLAPRWSQRAKVSSPVLDYLDRSIPKKTVDFAIPTYDHYEIYVKDGSINKSDQPVWVGPGPAGQNHWGYWVQPNKPLYPGGRFIVVANLNAVLFDGGNPYWHGMFPLIKLTMDPWPMTFLGKSAVNDAKSPHKLSNELLQGITDSARKALKPGAIIDRNAVNRMVLDKWDSSEPGYKLRTNPGVGQGVVIEPPPQLPPYVMELKNQADQHVDFVMGVLDMRSLSQLKMMSGDTDVETLLEHLGPTIRTKGRILEVFLRELGTMMRGNFFQFYTVARRVQILGRDGTDFEDYDYDPGSLIPAFSKDQFNAAFGEKAEAEMSRFGSSRAERARSHIQSFNYFITPNSLLNMAKTKDQLIFLQLFRMGVIDPVTLLEKLNVPNIGELPGSPKTILERMAAASEQGYVGAVSAAGRKASGQQMPQARPDGRMSESG